MHVHGLISNVCRVDEAIIIEAQRNKLPGADFGAASFTAERKICLRTDLPVEHGQYDSSKPDFLRIFVVISDESLGIIKKSRVDAKDYKCVPCKSTRCHHIKLIDDDTTKMRETAQSNNAKGEEWRMRNMDKHVDEKGELRFNALSDLMADATFSRDALLRLDRLRLRARENPAEATPLSDPLGTPCRAAECRAPATEIDGLVTAGVAKLVDIDRVITVELQSRRCSRCSHLNQ